MRILLLFSAIAMMIASCGKSPITQIEITKPQPLLTVEKARNAVEAQMTQTRTRPRATPTTDEYAMARALPGEFEVLWETAVESENEFVEAVEVKIKAQYRYAVLHYAQKHVVPIEQRLLINSRHDTLDPSSYILTIMPMKGSTAADFHFAGDSPKFSGYVMFKNLNDQFVCIAIYDKGKRTLSLLNSKQNQTKEFDDMLMDVVSRFKILGAPNVETKSCVVCYDPNCETSIHCSTCGQKVCSLHPYDLGGVTVGGNSRCQKCFKPTVPCDCCQQCGELHYGGTCTSAGGGECPFCHCTPCRFPSTCGTGGPNPGGGSGEPPTTGGGTQPDPPTEPGNPWPESQHNEIIQNAFNGRMSAADIEKVKRGSYEADKLQGTSYNYIHAQRTSDKDAMEAYADTRSYFSTEAIKYIKTRDLVSLGKALHPIMDAYHPAHSGFSVFDDFWDLWDHRFEFLNKPYLKEQRDAESAMVFILDELNGIYGGDVNYSDVEDVFDYWAAGYMLVYGKE